MQESLYLFVVAANKVESVSSQLSEGLMRAAR